jgi:uracil-DNA glycosylase
MDTWRIPRDGLNVWIIGMIDETLTNSWPLDYWQSKEWLDVQDRLDELERSDLVVNPKRCDLFRALALVGLRDCSVAIIGESPYPHPQHATGVAFSGNHWLPIAGDKRQSIPKSLGTIYSEYERDLALPRPLHACLEQWCQRGVLLWNATPTIAVKRFVSGSWETVSHRDWPEWPPLTQEIIERLSAKGGVVFVFLGKEAQKYAKFVDDNDNYNTVLKYAHPAARQHQFKGCRMFTNINAYLLNVHLKPVIYWRI